MAVVGSIVVVEGTKVAIEAINAFKEYSISYEKEVTERERIRATLEVCLKELEVKANFVQQALQVQHDARMKLYDLYQVGLTTSIERGDTVMFDRITQTLLLIYDKGPNLSEISGVIPSTSTRKLTHEG